MIRRDLNRTVLGLLLCLSGLGLATAAPTPAPAEAASPVTWTQLSARPAPPPGQQLAYGENPAQFGELRLPAGPGPHPVAVMIHGGCWLQDYDLAYFRHIAQAAADLGWASWNIEYRRVGGDGGWPQTFEDVADAIDHLRVLAASQPIALDQVIAVGHSAGAQLALWAAQRARIEQPSPLWRPQPLALQHVVALSPILDLARYRHGPRNSCHGAVDPLMGGSPQHLPQRYQAVSPIELLPLTVPVTLISGAADPTVSADSVRRYADLLAPDRHRLILIERAEHFDPVTPGSLGWAPVRQRLQALHPASAPVR